MKKSFFVIVLFFLVISSFNTSILFADDNLEIKIPTDAHHRAVVALKKLGPTRGALPISAKVVDIIGLVSPVKFDMEKIRETLEDLKARVSDTEIKISLSADVLFDFDKWNLREDALVELRKVVLIIKANKSTGIFIGGHTDSKGSAEYNLKLSLKRADSVKEWFVKNSSLSASLFKTIGYGEKKPIAANRNMDGTDNPQGRQKNRRVELVIRIVK